MPISKIIPAVDHISKSINHFSTIIKAKNFGRTKWKSLYLTIEKKRGKWKNHIAIVKNYFFRVEIIYLIRILVLPLEILQPEKLHYATKGIDIPKHLSFSSIAVVRTGENIKEWEVVRGYLKAE